MEWYLIFDDHNIQKCKAKPFEKVLPHDNEKYKAKFSEQMCVSSVGQVRWEATVPGRAAGGGLVSAMDAARPPHGSGSTEPPSSWHQPNTDAALTVTAEHFPKKIRQILQQQTIF